MTFPCLSRQHGDPWNLQTDLVFCLDSKIVVLLILSQTKPQALERTHGVLPSGYIFTDVRPGFSLTCHRRPGFSPNICCIQGGAG